MLKSLDLRQLPAPALVVKRANALNDDDEQDSMMA